MSMFPPPPSPGVRPPLSISEWKSRMKHLLGKFKHGVVVCNNVAPDKYSWDMDIGHVVGFSRNDLDEPILIVKWSRGRKGSIHPNNVSILSEEEEDE